MNVCREGVLPIKRIKNKPAYYKRMNEVQQRRIKLVHTNSSTYIHIKL